jgi:hypothetical protein
VNEASRPVRGSSMRGDKKQMKAAPKKEAKKTLKGSKKPG